MTTLEITINSRKKSYSIDVSDWDAEKWDLWHHVTETWGHNEWFQFTRYLDSVNNDVWDALHNARHTITFMGKSEISFCDNAMRLLGHEALYSNSALIIAAINYQALTSLLKDELTDSNYKVVREDETGIFYIVKR